MLLKEYRICMPLAVDEYKIGQLYMIAKHSYEQSNEGEGVEMVKNEPCESEEYGKGQFTEKRVHLSSRLPTWIQAVIPRVFYITEKAWNYYPYTITEYTCSFIPKYSIEIETRYENNAGTTDNCLGINEEELVDREVVFVDIAEDEVPEHKYKEAEDPTKFTSKKTGRGPLGEGWKEKSDPIMCSYKAVRVKFEVWGLQTKVEAYSHSAVQDVLLLGHRQAFTWIDEWYGMSMNDIREYEKKMHEETNKKIGSVIESDLPKGLPPATPTNTPENSSPDEPNFAT